MSLITFLCCDKPLHVRKLDVMYASTWYNCTFGTEHEERNRDALGDLLPVVALLLEDLDGHLQVLRALVTRVLHDELHRE